MKPMYLCAGMSRSGSTWLYNVVRLLTEQHYDPVHVGYVTSFQADWRANFEAAVIKVHDKTPKLVEGSVIFTCYRDLRDVAASLMLKKWVNASNVIGALHSAVEGYEYYRPLSTFEFEYRLLIGEPVSLIESIAEVMGLWCEPQAIARAVQDMEHSKYSSATYDSTNLLHHQHFTKRVPGYYKEVLSPKLIEQIEDTFGPWLKEKGYA